MREWRRSLSLRTPSDLTPSGASARGLRKFLRISRATEQSAPHPRILKRAPLSVLFVPRSRRCPKLVVRRFCVDLAWVMFGRLQICAPSAFTFPHACLGESHVDIRNRLPRFLTQAPARAPCPVRVQHTVLKRLQMGARIQRFFAARSDLCRGKWKCVLEEEFGMSAPFL